MPQPRPSAVYPVAIEIRFDDGTFENPKIGPEADWNAAVEWLSQVIKQMRQRDQGARRQVRSIRIMAGRNRIEELVGAKTIEQKPG